MPQQTKKKTTKKAKPSKLRAFLETLAAVAIGGAITGAGNALAVAPGKPSAMGWGAAAGALATAGALVIRSPWTQPAPAPAPADEQ